MVGHYRYSYDCVLISIIIHGPRVNMSILVDKCRQFRITASQPIYMKSITHIFILIKTASAFVKVFNTNVFY